MGYLMEELTVNELREILDNHTKTAVLPVGIVEQHGYHLPLFTDAIVATEIAKQAAPDMNAVVLPTIPYCYSGGKLTGTINVSIPVFALLVKDIVSELLRMGFKNVILFLGHGGYENTQAIENVLNDVLADERYTQSVCLSVVGAWDLSNTWGDMMAIKPEADTHAGWAETSIMMHLRPELVRDEIVMDKPDVAKYMRTGEGEKLLEKKRVVDHPMVMPEYIPIPGMEIKVGITGFPHKANSELGYKIFEEARTELIKLVNLIDRENR